MMEVKFKRLSRKAKRPIKMRHGDACYDLASIEDRDIEGGTTAMISTGLALEIPEGYKGMIRGRSGMQSRGIFVQTGTVDSNYRGVIKVSIFNSTYEQCHIKEGHRIAQIAIEKAEDVLWTETNSLGETERGENGYGSSGD